MKKISDEEFVDFTRKRLARKKKWCKVLTVLFGILLIAFVCSVFCVNSYSKGLFNVADDDFLFQGIVIGIMMGSVLGLGSGIVFILIADVFINNISRWIFKDRWDMPGHLMIKYYDLYNELKSRVCTFCQHVVAN